LRAGPVVKYRHIDATPHRWREPLRRIGLKRSDLPTPIICRSVIRPSLDLQQMHQHLPQVAEHGVEFGQANVLDLLDDMLPVDAIHPLPSCETAQ
jgi:hypothetical protein